MKEAIELDFLGSVPLFADLDADRLEHFSRFLRVRDVLAGDMVQSEEDRPQRFYIIRRGRFKVARFLPSGKEMILGFRESKDTFGVVGLVDGGLAPASVTAVLPSTLYLLRMQVFPELLQEPLFVAALRRLLSQRCRDAWHQAELLAVNNAEARVRAALFQLSRRRGIDTDKGKLISLRLTHNELSDIAGVTRETVTRILSQLQESELLQIQARYFLIRDPDRLLDDLLVA